VNLGKVSDEPTTFTVGLGVEMGTRTGVQL